MSEKVLHIKTNEIELTEIPRVMSECGISVCEAPFKVKGTAFDAAECQKTAECIRTVKPDFVFTYNFILTVSRACQEQEVPYISWVYDCPQSELYSEEALNPCNYIFLFDKDQYEKALNTGIKNAFYMPLASYGKKLEDVLKTKPLPERDIAFVGQLYRNDYLLMLEAKAEGEVLKAFKDYESFNLFKWGNEDEDAAKSLLILSGYFENADSGKTSKRYPYIDKSSYYEAAALSRILANRERVTAINTLSEKYDTHFYTFDSKLDQLDSSVTIHKNGAKYETELSKVYKNTRINLNITLHCIKKGACQRVFDVMASGGFLLSNYQEALEELFVPDKEIVMFHDLDELEEKVSYYLTHEEERRKIAKAGQEKVLKEHLLEIRVPQMLQAVRKAEEERKTSYSELLKNALTLEGIEASSNQFAGFDAFMEKLQRVSDRLAVNTIFLNIANHYAKIDMLSAIKVLIYSRKMAPGDLTLRVFEAKLMLELGMLKEANEALCMIDSPSDEIKNLIDTISGAINS